MHQRVLPDLTEQGVKAVTRGAKEVVYISRSVGPHINNMQSFLYFLIVFK